MNDRRITNGMVAGAIKFARETWRNDGAEGEAVHLLCDAIEQLKSLARCSWCDATTANTPEAMVEHMLTCEKRTAGHEVMLRRAATIAADLEAALLDCRGQLEMLYVTRTRMGEEEIAWTTVLEAIDRANGLLGNRVFADELGPPISGGPQ